MSARQALRDVSINVPSRTRLRGVSMTRVSWTFALRNSFRRPVRLGMTLFSLGLGGAMLLGAANVHRSLLVAVDRALNARGDDVEVRLLRPAPTGALSEAMTNLRHARRVELWGSVLAGVTGAMITPTGAGPATRYPLLAPPAAQMHGGADLVSGSWLGQDSPVAQLVVNRQLKALEPDLRPGTRVTLVVGQRQTQVVVAGIVEEVAPPTGYVSPAAMQVVTAFPGHVGSARLTAMPGMEDQLATELEALLAERGLAPVYLMTRSELRQAMVDHFGILLAVLTAIALAAVLVGLIGLTTTMGLNLMERRREMGVLRALGGTPSRTRWIILLEGLFIALPSVAIAFLFSLPLTAAIGAAVGKHGLNVSLPFVLSPVTLLAWTILAVGATVLIGLLLARRVTAPPVRTLVAYDE